MRGDGGRPHLPDQRGVLTRAQRGDRRALNTLFGRELPRLRCWAQARVPRRLWPRADVDDFVQLTFIRALGRYHHFTVRESATFQHYLRRIFLNLVRDELRREARQPETTELFDLEGDVVPDALDLLLGRESRRRYRTALLSLPVRTRAALIARLEQGAPYGDIARRLGAPSEGAARALVARGVRSLTAEMRRLSRARRSPHARTPPPRPRRYR